MQHLVDFTLDDVLPVLQVKQVSEQKVQLVPIPSSILELTLRLQQEDLSPILLEEDKVLMEDQNPSLPGMVATAQPGGLSMRMSTGFTPIMTGVMMHLSLGKLSKESLPSMVELIALYFTLVYRGVGTGEHGIMMQTLQLQEQGLWIMALELQSLSCRAYTLLLMTFLSQN